MIFFFIYSYALWQVLRKLFRSKRIPILSAQSDYMLLLLLFTPYGFFFPCLLLFLFGCFSFSYPFLFPSLLFFSASSASLLISSPLLFYSLLVVSLTLLVFYQRMRIISPSSRLLLVRSKRFATSDRWKRYNCLKKKKKNCYKIVLVCRFVRFLTAFPNCVPQLAKKSLKSKPKKLFPLLFLFFSGNDHSLRFQNAIRRKVSNGSESLRSLYSALMHRDNATLSAKVNELTARLRASASSSTPLEKLVLRINDQFPGNTEVTTKKWRKREKKKVCKSFL